MATKHAPAPSPERKRSISGWMIGGIGAAIVSLAAVIAIVSSSDEPAASPPGLSQTQPVEVTGTALPEFASDAPDSAIGVTAPTLSGTPSTDRR
jgi:hypothetical protein